MTAVAGNGYWINTTSNACVITLPSSASNGDEIIFADYARTWGTYGIIIDLRKKSYPTWQDQFDDIYHNGIAGWKATIKTTKDKYPKRL